MGDFHDFNVWRKLTHSQSQMFFKVFSFWLILHSSSQTSGSPPSSIQPSLDIFNFWRPLLDGLQVVFICEEVWCAGRLFRKVLQRALRSQPEVRSRSAGRSREVGLFYKNNFIRTSIPSIPKTDSYNRGMNKKNPRKSLKITENNKSLKRAFEEYFTPRLWRG